MMPAFREKKIRRRGSRRLYVVGGLAFALAGCFSFDSLTGASDAGLDASTDAGGDADASTTFDSATDGGADDGGCVYAWSLGAPTPTWLVFLGASRPLDGGLVVTNGAQYSSGALYVRAPVNISRFDLSATVTITKPTPDASMGDGLGFVFVRNAVLGQPGGQRGFFGGSLDGYTNEFVIVPAKTDPPYSFYGFATDENAPDGSSSPPIGNTSQLPAAFLDGNPAVLHVYSNDGVTVTSEIDGAGSISTIALTLGYDGYFGIVGGSGSYVMITTVSSLRLSLPDLATCP